MIHREAEREVLLYIFYKAKVENMMPLLLRKHSHDLFPLRVK